MLPRNGANSGDMTLDFGATIGAIQLASICVNLHRFALKAGDVKSSRDLAAGTRHELAQTDT